MARIRIESGATPDSDGQLRRVRFDPATVIGFATGFGLLVIAMAAGGDIEAYIDLPALMIVLGGTFGVTTVCFSIEDIARAQRIAAKAIVNTRPDARIAALRMLQFAERARRDSILALESSLHELADDPIAEKSIAMAIDGSTPEEIETVLERDILEMQNRHMMSAGIFRKAAEIAPSMGLIGTLIGLVQMLSRLEDPASIGPSMAIALLTTFYGAVLSSMVFTPLAAKLEKNSSDEMLVARIYMISAATISRKDNPRKLETQLNALLPSAKRLTYFA